MARNLIDLLNEDEEYDFEENRADFEKQGEFGSVVDNFARR